MSPTATGCGGDAGLAAWIIVACYAAAAVLCARALHAARLGARRSLEHAGPERRAADRAGAYRASQVFWALVAAVCVGLGLNKQMDMQCWLTAVGRRLAEAQGWYDRRLEVQVAFVLCTAGLGLLGLGAALALTRELLPRHVLAFAGVSLLAVFVALRAGSFHDVDALMVRPVAGIRPARLLELAGIALIGLSAWRNASRGPRTDAAAS